MQDANPMNEIVGRLRINESKISTLRERLLVTDSNMIGENKNLSQDIKSLSSEIMELKNELNLIRETIKDIARTTENFASTQDLKVLEKYINMWNPLNFVTEKEVKKIIKENG
tara:strand:+ start:934 stop:1272 length:339 start_codon:yes stop_codon:yes gene_type:complete